MTPPPNLPAARCTRCGYTEIAPSHIYSHNCGGKLPAHPDLSPPQPEKGKGGEVADLLDWLSTAALNVNEGFIRLTWLNPNDHSEYLSMELRHHIPLDEFQAHETLSEAIEAQRKESK